MTKEAIGGYLELELPSSRGEFYPDAQRFQSARAAFLALLLAGKPRRVWIPWYICSSMIETLKLAGVSFTRYAVDNGLGIKDNITLESGEWFLFVNYFGVCSTNVDRVLDSFPRNQVIIDNSQAFFSPPSQALATIYSPRKFFGVPDGGYLFTDLPIPEPDEEDEGSIRRCAHLLKRLSGAPEAGYADFGVAEESLTRQFPKRMSLLTRRLLSTIDYGAIQVRRSSNFATLHDKLRDSNRFSFRLERDEAPMCYPFFGVSEGTRSNLIASRIFVPTYWPDVILDQNAPQFERTFARDCLHLPCDQRNEKSDQMRVLATLTEVTVD